MILTTSDPVCIARDPAALEAEWSELARTRAQPTVFLTPDWIGVARAHDHRPQITASIDSRGVAALALEDNGAFSFAGGELTDYQDVVARPQDVAQVATALGGWIAERGAPVRMKFVPEESGTVEAMSASLDAAGYDVAIDRLVTSPRVELPDSFEAYLQSLGGKKRHELRRKLRRLEAGRRIAFRFASSREQTSAVDRFMALHRMSRGEKAQFMTPEVERFFRDVADAMAARGWLRLGVLSVDGDDSAVLFGFAYEGILSVYNAAYDPALASVSVGIASQAYAIRSAIADGLRTYDLLRGGERFKYDLGAIDHWLLRLDASRP
ncbi:MAG: GNAT family N-acetyltransferase [Chloroflexi bacterium]|nr:MAG: GNAT family N-acetyltransferase [Chloroflexota bacterium]